MITKGKIFTFVLWSRATMRSSIFWRRSSNMRSCSEWTSPLAWDMLSLWGTCWLMNEVDRGDTPAAGFGTRNWTAFAGAVVGAAWGILGAWHSRIGDLGLRTWLSSPELEDPSNWTGARLPRPLLVRRPPGVTSKVFDFDKMSLFRPRALHFVFWHCGNQFVNNHNELSQQTHTLDGAALSEIRLSAPFPCATTLARCRPRIASSKLESVLSRWTSDRSHKLSITFKSTSRTSSCPSFTTRTRTNVLREIRWIDTPTTTKTSSLDVSSRKRSPASMTIFVDFFKSLEPKIPPRKFKPGSPNKVLKLSWKQNFKSKIVVWSQNNTINFQLFDAMQSNNELRLKIPGARCWWCPSTKMLMFCQTRLVLQKIKLGSK